MPTTPPPPTAVDDLKAKIAQVDALIADGTLAGDEARQARDRLERELLAAVLGPDRGAAATARAARGDARADGTEAQADPVVRPARGLVASIALFVIVFAGAGYAWLGNHAGWSIAPGTPAAEQEAVAQAAQQQQIDAMIDKLAARLKDKPDDPDGWALLGRSYNAQGRFAEAVPAYRKSLELRPQDAQTLVDYADALAMTNNRSLLGEPERLIQQALQIDPANVKALALAGTVAFNQSRYAAAVDYWERATAQGDPQSEFAQQLRSALDEARQRAGMPAAPSASASASSTRSPGAAAAAPAPPSVAAAGSASVSGRVTLADAAKGQVGPDDTVFVFARPASGARMPLAILRRKVSDLPLDFTLDDSMAMSPAARLSSTAQVIVGARISKSGNAMPAPGDWQGQSAPVATGTQGLRIEIGEPVR